MPTEQQRDAVGRYIRWIANEIELRDWRFELSATPAEDALAKVYPTYGRKVAVIELGPDFFFTEAPEDQRQTIVHELVHCHLESACNMVRNDLEQTLGRPADQVFFNGFRRQIEYGVDALADALAKHLPVIDWTDVGDE